MNLKKIIQKIVNRCVNKVGYELRKISPDFYLHQYSSYDEYKKVQVRYNIEKIRNIWADSATLDLVIQRVKLDHPSTTGMFALCHGARNGFEQNYIASKLQVDIFGTDISETALDFERSVHWDFHDENDAWIKRCDFIYTNSLDQSWKPKDAISTWLDQLKKGGLLFIEHTEAHGASEAGEMDPFGAAPHYMPYLLCEWFGHQITIEIITSIKSNNKSKVWLFVLKKIN